MAREAHIKEPVKVTLYLPKTLAKDSKDFSKDVEKTSLSRLVTNLLHEKVYDNVEVALEIEPEMYKELRAIAKKKRKDSVEALIQDAITEMVSQAEPKKPAKRAPRKRAAKKTVAKKPTTKRATKKK